MRYNVYTDHRGNFLSLFPVAHIDEVRAMADNDARRGIDNLYRVFARSGSGEQFTIALSVMHGQVRDLNDVTIPRAHW